MSRVVPRVMSMLDVGYPESPLNSESHTRWLNRGPRSGERAPDAEQLLVAGKTDLQRLFSLWTGDDRHQLLVFGSTAMQIPVSPLYAITHILREGVPSGGVIVDTQGDAHEAYAVHKEGTIYLVRPDGIVAFRRSEPDTAALSHYLGAWYNVD